MRQWLYITECRNCLHCLHWQGLTKLLADNAPGCMREQKLENYFGRKIAVDASMHIYAFMVRQVGGTGFVLLMAYLKGSTGCKLRILLCLSLPMAGGRRPHGRSDPDGRSWQCDEVSCWEHWYFCVNVSRLQSRMDFMSGLFKLHPYRRAAISRECFSAP